MGAQVPNYDLESLEFLEIELDCESILSKYRLSSFKKEAEFLFRRYPPKLSSSRKLAILKIARDSNVRFEGTVKFSRFKEMDLPKEFSESSKTEQIFINNSYDYQRLENYNESTQREWHLNFADRNLFGFYHGNLFAQDEIQVAEIPVLACVREYLNSVDVGALNNPELIPLTRNKEFASPCLIRNVQRRVKISVDVNEEEGRMNGLYGSNFKKSSKKVIEKATKSIEKPQLENIIAMEAPQQPKKEQKYYNNQKNEEDDGDNEKIVIGSGFYYDFNTLLFILRTAYTGFKGAIVESWDELFVATDNNNNNNIRTIVHTGAWGTGANGGNKVVMALLQIAASHLARIDTLVFHSYNNEEKNKKAYFDALEIFEKKRNSFSVFDFLKSVEERKFKWGVEDGN